MKRLGPGNQGSVMASALVATTAVALGLFYTFNSSQRIQTALKESMSLRAREAGTTNNISSLGIVRSLMNDTKTTSTDYQPAIYANNYFSAPLWDLTRNDLVQGSSTVSKNSIKVPTFADAETSIAGAASVFMKTPQSKLMTETQTLEVLQLNRDKAHLNYISSVDVKSSRFVKSAGPNGSDKTIVTYGRVSLAAPVPSGLKLYIREATSSVYTQNFGSAAAPLKPANYVFKLTGNGVVAWGEVSANGVVRKVGINAAGNITHQANNPTKKDITIGETAPPLDFTVADGTQSVEVTKAGCSVSATSLTDDGEGVGAIEVTAKLVGVDGTTTTDTNVKKTVYIQTSTKKKPALTAAGICVEMCPATPKKAAADATGQHIDQAKFYDFSLATPGQASDYVQFSLGSGAGGAKGVVCSNLNKMGQKLETLGSGLIPSKFYLAKPVPYGVAWEEAAQLREVYAYAAPSCERKLVGTRGNCGCFAPDTNILMADGSEMPVKMVREGDILWNPRTQKAQSVRKVIAGPEKLPLYEITVEGKSLLVTQGHPFLTTKGLLSASALKVGDVVIDADQHSPIQAIRLREPSEVDNNVWNFELEGSDSDDDHYVLANGVMTGDLVLQNKLSGKIPKTP